MRMCIIICQSQRDKGTGEPDEAISFMSGSEGGWGKRPAMDLARSLPSGSPIRRTPRRWPSAARRWGRRRWRCPWRWTGRRCVRSGATCTRSAAPPVGSSWSAPRSSHGRAPHRWCWLGSVPHERGTAGEACQGRGVLAGGCRAVGAGVRRGAEGLKGLDLPGVRSWMGPMAVVPGRRTEGERRVNSIAYGWQDVVRPHQYAVRPTRGWSGHRAAGVGGRCVGSLRPGAAQP